MYLAATSDILISPSEIVDIVWHQHLIFTESYQEFCKILGKQIQHIPSTHNKEEFEKFKKAKDRTLEYYKRIFGEQPKNIWGFKDMFESLNLEKAEIKTQTFILIGILSFIFLISPTYSLLKPIYGQIDNPYFIIGFICLMFGAFFKLELYNKEKIKNIVSQFDKTSFIYDLQPLELVYSKTQKLSNVINGEVNEHIDNGTIKVNADDNFLYSNSKTDRKTKGYG